MLILLESTVQVLVMPPERLCNAQKVRSRFHLWQPVPRCWRGAGRSLREIATAAGERVRSFDQTEARI